MLTPARVGEYTGPSALLDLLRDLGYPVAPVEVDPAEWRRGGVSIPWQGEARLLLAARLPRFDLFVLTGSAEETAVAEFMRSYADYNCITKSAILYQSEDHNTITIFDLGRERILRRLDVDPARPGSHALDRLNLLARGDDALLPRIFDRALDRESITREFFQRFRGGVRDVAHALAAQFPVEAQAAVDAQALLILSRLLFLSFIQEKGWLAGERRFLVDRLDHESRKGREFFSGVLAPLFWGCLNTPLHARTLAARRLGSIPYLNGGLFEPSRFERRHPDMQFSNALMRRVVEGVFERFDFRIDETAGGGTHVDPEMLGKVFESLMAADERAATGSFYTPKEIVDVLTERAIREWLGDGGVETLQSISVLDPACGSGAFLLSALGAIERIWRSLGGVPPPRDLRRRIVSRSLFGVDLKPEAVRLCELRLWLAIVSGSDAGAEEVEPLPNLDRNILQGNSLLSPTDFLGHARVDIYGQWLTALRAQRDLLERYRTAPHEQRPALYRLIRGNDQRLAVELLARCVEHAEQELRSASAPQRDLFGRAVRLDGDLCRELHRRVTESRQMLERVEEGSLDFFSYDVHFAPVMAAGGFDVVVGNPPWVRNSRIEPHAKRMLSDRYRFFRGARGSVAFNQPDLSVAFFERAHALAAPDGVVSMLLPAKIANAAYAAPLRDAVSGSVIAFDDWSDDPRRRRWFDADTYPMGVTTHGRQDAAREIHVASGGETFSLTAAELSCGPAREWHLVPREAGAVLRRLRRRYATLEETLARKPFMGVKTGANASFFVEGELRGASLLVDDDIRIPLTALCRCVRGRDLRRWRTDASHWMLWPPQAGWKSVPRWLERLASRRAFDPAALRLAFVRPEHVGIKVAWKDLSRGMAAAVLPDVVNVGGHAIPLVPNQTLYAIDAVSLDEAHLLAAILNSTVCGALLLAAAERAKDAHYRYFGRTIASLPWPATQEEAAQLSRLSRRAHRGADVHDEIDQVVSRLYGVTQRELSALREFVERRIGAR